MPKQSPRAGEIKMFKEEDIVFSYTTKMAVDDGVLIQIPVPITGPLGILVPVYFTDSVWNRYIDPNPKTNNFQTKSAEITRILKPYTTVARTCSRSFCNFKFRLPSPLFLTDKRNEILNQDGSLTVSLKAVITAEDIDNSKPAVFIMLPWED